MNPPKPKKLSFCESLVIHKGKLMDFDGRPYLPAIYAVHNQNLILRASRQVEKSTLLANTILYLASVYPGVQILYVCPRLEQASVFSGDRLLQALEQSPLLRLRLLGTSSRKPPLRHIRFKNGSTVYIKAAYRSADPARGISADVLMVDEFQDIAPGHLGVLQETLSHSSRRQTILTGTPKTIDNQLETMFSQSTANEWTIPCPDCGQGVILDERCLGPKGITCPACKCLLDPTSGRWIARNPHAVWGQGFWLNHLMVKWANYDEVLERQRTYDIGTFKNEVLGLSTRLGDLVVTRAELEACCSQRTMASSAEDVPDEYRDTVFAGIDWGGGGTSRTVVCIGYMDRDFIFQIIHLARFRASEEPDYILRAVAELCRKFGVRTMAADGGGNGHVLNRLLLDQLKLPYGLYAILYSAADSEPRPDGILTKWTVNRSATIGGLVSRIKKQTIIFPRLEDCSTFLDEFACEYVKYDDEMRTVRYTHPENQPDDALHATNYALKIAIRGFHMSRMADDNID